jgi:release factor glutamine methyltransferase
MGKPYEDLSVVDIGCGSGAISLALVHSLSGLRVACVDQSKLACHLTLENARSLNLVSGARFIKIDRSETFKNRSFS